MPFAKGRSKTGGRSAGSNNKLKAEERKLRGLELLEERCDPLGVMVDLIENPKASLELRGKMAEALAKYVYVPKKAVEVTGPNGGKLEIVVRRIGG